MDGGVTYVWVREPIGDDVGEAEVHDALSKSQEAFFRLSGSGEVASAFPALAWPGRPFSLDKDVGGTGRGIHIAESHHFLPSWISGNVHEDRVAKKVWSYELLEASLLAEVAARFDEQALGAAAGPGMFEVTGEGVEAVVGLFIRPIARVLLRLTHPKFSTVTAARASTLERDAGGGHGPKLVPNLHREVVALIPIDHPVTVGLDELGGGAASSMEAKPGTVVLTGAGRLTVHPLHGTDPWVLVVGLASRNAEEGPEAQYRKRCPVHFQQSYHHKGLMHAKEEL